MHGRISWIESFPHLRDDVRSLSPEHVAQPDILSEATPRPDRRTKWVDSHGPRKRSLVVPQLVNQPYGLATSGDFLMATDIPTGPLCPSSLITYMRMSRDTDQRLDNNRQPLSRGSVVPTRAPHPRRSPTGLVELGTSAVNALGLQEPARRSPHRGHPHGGWTLAPCDMGRPDGNALRESQHPEGGQRGEEIDDQTGSPPGCLPLPPALCSSQAWSREPERSPQTPPRSERTPGRESGLPRQEPPQRSPCRSQRPAAQPERSTLLGWLLAVSCGRPS
jgi:hypothetical protein